ncbi:MAG TPA: restriction endonuclease subunit S [Baekduia sp.]|nr:restriction endonuclease subunit S [Baekduia sp.]
MPSDWQEAELQAVADVTIGRQRSPKYASGPHSVPYLRAANVKDGRLVLDDVLEMSFDSAERVAYGLRPGDVLVTEGCGSLSEVGASARWLGERDDPMCFQNTLLRLRALPGMTTPEFLHQWARWAHHAGIWASISSGTNIFHIGLQRARSLKVQLPPLDEQRRIVDLMDAVDDQIAASSRLAAAAGDALNAQIVSAGADFHNRSTVALGEIAEITGGITKDAKKQHADFVDVPYLRVANVQRGFLDLSEVTSIRAPADKVEKLSLHVGDVLFNEGGDRDKLGRGWVWEGEISPCIHQNHVFRARLRGNEFDPYFVSIWGNSPMGQQWFEAMGSQTTNLASINLRTLKSFPIPSVDPKEQRKIVELYMSLRSVRLAAVDQAESLKALRRSMLDELLGSEHRIPDSYDALLDEAS